MKKKITLFASIPALIMGLTGCGKSDVPNNENNGSNNSNNGQNENHTLSKSYVKSVVDDYKNKNNYTATLKDANQSEGVTVSLDGDKLAYADTLIFVSFSSPQDADCYQNFYGDWLKTKALETFTGLGVLFLAVLLSPSLIIPSAAELLATDGNETVGIHSYVYETDTKQYYFTFDDTNTDITEIKYSTRDDITKSFELDKVCTFKDRGKINITLPTNLIDLNDNVITFYELQRFTSETHKFLEGNAYFEVHRSTYIPEYDVSTSSSLTCIREGIDTLVITSGSKVYQIDYTDPDNPVYYKYNDESHSFDEMSSSDVSGTSEFGVYKNAMDILTTLEGCTKDSEATFSTTGFVTTYSKGTEFKYEVKFNETNPDGGFYFSQFKFTGATTVLGSAAIEEVTINVSYQ